MNRASSRRRWRYRAGAAVLAALPVAAGLGTFAGPSVSGAVTSFAPSIATSLATSVQTGEGTWATLPMGHLDQPLNTFWQLFYRPTGTNSWTDKVEATAVATNGGLVLASATGQPFVAGVRPTNFLAFSPLIATTDGGRSWSNGLLPVGLAADPGALSTAPDGETLALVGRGTRAKVLVTTGDLSIWRTLTTARTLASGSGGKACGIGSLTTVASLAGMTMVGASCERPGVVGIFAERAGSWQLSTFALPPSLSGDRIEVLDMAETPSGLSALLGIAGRGRTALVAAWTTGAGGWSVSPALALEPGARLESFGPAGGTGLFALTSTASGAKRLAVTDGAGLPWHQMPPPPPGTDTVAFGTAGAPTIDALAGSDTTMTVWAFNQGSSDWVKGQVVHVHIEFGSSS
jgi:hypothetical protein